MFFAEFRELRVAEFSSELVGPTNRLVVFPEQRDEFVVYHAIVVRGVIDHARLRGFGWYAGQNLVEVAELTKWETIWFFRLSRRTFFTFWAGGVQSGLSVGSVACPF